VICCDSGCLPSFLKAAAGNYVTHVLTQQGHYRLRKMQQVDAKASTACSDRFGTQTFARTRRPGGFQEIPETSKSLTPQSVNACLLKLALYSFACLDWTGTNEHSLNALPKIGNNWNPGNLTAETGNGLHVLRCALSTHRRCYLRNSVCNKRQISENTCTSSIAPSKLPVSEHDASSSMTTVCNAAFAFRGPH